MTTDIALKSGIGFGRPKAKATKEFKEVYKRWKLKELTAVEAMQELEIKKTTFYKLEKNYESELQ